MKDSNGKFDILKTLSILANGVMLIATVVSVTVAVEKSAMADKNGMRIDGLVSVVDGMRDVDAGMLNQIVELRGRQTADTMLLNEKIANITTLLQEIKILVKR